MPGKLEALAILFVLLPGFLCAYIIQQLAVRRVQTDTEKVIEGVIFSFIIYLTNLPFFQNTLPLSWVSGPDGTIRVAFHFPQLFCLLLSSLMIGVVYAASINHDWLMKVFRGVHVTERTARSSVWNDVFQEIGGYVQVAFRDGSYLIGYVRYYSDEASESTIFLEDAAWVDADGEHAIPGPGILITKDSGIDTITFLDPTT